MGTRDGLFGNALGKGFGYGGDARIERMYQRLVQTYNGVDQRGNPLPGGPDRDIDIFGFSRGGALARHFANYIEKRGIPILTSEQEITVHNGRSTTRQTVYDQYFPTPEIRFMGIFDTVGSFGKPGNPDEGNKDLSISPIVKNVRHAISAKEQRFGFPLTSAIDLDNPTDPRIKEIIFDGVHTDVGGGYDDDNSLARDPLYWIWQEAKQQGVPLGAMPIHLQPVPPSNALSPKLVRKRNGRMPAIYTPQEGGRTEHNELDSLHWQILQLEAAFDEGINQPRRVFYNTNRTQVNSKSNRPRVIRDMEDHKSLLMQINPSAVVNP